MKLIGMRCPRCDAPTEVLDTRGTIRRRECFNGHVFRTEETWKQNLPPRKKSVNAPAPARGQK